MTLAGQCNPFARPTFTGVIATTSCSAPVPRVATCTLTETIGLSSLLCIGATGSHVPHQSLIRAHAAFMPSAAQPVDRYLLGFVPGQPSIPVSTPIKLTTRHQRFTCIRLPESHLPRSKPRLFLQRSPRRLLIDAAWSGLKPGPATRLRGADPHL